MKQRLILQMKHNLKRPPRVYVYSSGKGQTQDAYGTFPVDDPAQFDGWDKLDQDQAAELRHYIENLDAIKKVLNPELLRELIDYRLRLPVTLTQAIDDIDALCHAKGGALSIYEPIVTTIVQQLKIAAAKLDGDDKQKALSILTDLGFAEYSKLNMTSQTCAVFAELLSIQNKVEKLRDQAKVLFNKLKTPSYETLAGMAKGDFEPSKWLVASAIEVIAHEKVDVLRSALSADDIFLLWGKQLLEHGHSQQEVIKMAQKFELPVLVDRIKAYQPKAVKSAALKQ